MSKDVSVVCCKCFRATRRLVCPKRDCGHRICSGCREKPTPVRVELPTVRTRGFAKMMRRLAEAFDSEPKP